MGKNKRKTNKIKWCKKSVSTIDKTIQKLNSKNKKAVINIIKPKSLKLSELQVALCEEYINLFGSKYHDTKEDLNDILEIILIHYNRIVKSENIDTELLFNLKKAALNLVRIVNYYIYDEEIIKLTKVIDMMDDRNTVSSYYLREELDIIYSQLRRSENKVYLLLMNRLKNNNIQQRYIDAYKKSLKKNEVKEEVKEEVLTKTDLDSVIADLDDLYL